MSDYTRMKSDERRAIIMTAALHVANTDGLGKVNYDTVSEACRIETSRHTVKHYFPTKPPLLKAILADDRVTKRVLDTGRAMGLVE